MNPAPRTASQLYNRSTSYEIVLTNGAVSHRVEFDMKKTKSALFNAMVENGPAIKEIVGDFNGDIEYKAKAWVIGDSGFKIAFSGRTEREFSEIV